MTGALHDLSGSDSDDPQRGLLPAADDELDTLKAAPEAALAELRARYDTLEERRRAAELAREQALEAARKAALRPVLSEEPPHSSERHLVFVPTPAGYAVLERPGAAPNADSDLALPSGERFRVIRVGPSPMPGEPDTCAYLERIGPICGPRPPAG